MALPRQSVFPGALESAYRAQLSDLVNGEAVRRLWAKDDSLWPADHAQRKVLQTNLRWLDLPNQIGPYMARVATFANEIEAEGFQDAVFVGMGDSNLAAETIASLSLPKRWKRIFILDTTDPGAVRAFKSEANLERTLFIFASKTGKRIESHVLLLYFLEILKARGVEEPGRQFVAVTEEGSYLAQVAKQYQFRGIFFDPPGISGRYSALIHFGLLLSGLCRTAPTNLLLAATSMNDLCRHGDLRETNPALNLAAFLASGATQGSDRLLLFGTASLAGLTHRVAQLVGVSTSKGGQGIIPICVEVPCVFDAYRHGCQAAIFSMHGDEDSGVRQVAHELQDAGIPCVLIELDSPEDLAAELFKWEVATALACALLEVNPFDEPDILESTSKAAAMLERLARRRDLAERTVRLSESGIDLYAEGQARQQISTLSLPDALRTFFDAKKPDGYLATLAFLDRSAPNLRAALRRMGDQISSHLGIPALLSFGPRYLHHLGQVFQGGPSKGIFMMLTGEPTEDIPIPGAGYSFGQLQLALALGDFETLTQHQKPVVRLHLTEGVEQGLPKLERILREALNIPDS